MNGDKKEREELSKKNDQLIMVVRRKHLFGENGEDAFDGFRSHDIKDHSSHILTNHGYISRKLAETDPNYKQPIAYVLLANPLLKKVYLYQRAIKDEEYNEKRLQGKYSIGVGGHIDLEDGDKTNPLHDSLFRELEEELGISRNDISNLRVLGYINDDTNSVGQVHFGVLNLAETNLENVSPKGEMISGEFVDLNHLGEIVSNPNVSF